MCPIGGPHRALIRETAVRGAPPRGLQIEDAPLVPLSPRNLFFLVFLPCSFFLSLFFFSLSFTLFSFFGPFAQHVYFLLSLEPQLRPETRKSSKGDRWAPTEPSAEEGGMGEGGKWHRLPPLPVSEIKRRGRNLVEGCKYYKVTLRRMRELKGLPRKGGQRSPGGQCERVSKLGAPPPRTWIMSERDNLRHRSRWGVLGASSQSTFFPVPPSSLTITAPFSMFNQFHILILQYLINFTHIV